MLDSTIDWAIGLLITDSLLGWGQALKNNFGDFKHTKINDTINWYVDLEAKEIFGIGGGKNKKTQDMKTKTTNSCWQINKQTIPRTMLHKLLWFWEQRGTVHFTYHDSRLQQLMGEKLFSVKLSTTVQVILSAYVYAKRAFKFPDSRD